MWHYFWGDMNSHLPTPVRELMIDQSKDTTDDQHGQPMSFIIATYRTLMGVYFQEQTQRQLYHQSPYQRVWEPMKAGNLEHTTQRADSSTG